MLVPGWNDGEDLRQTVEGLTGFRPLARSVAIVPVGLTAHRAELPALRRPTAEESRALVDQAEVWQRESLEQTGERFVFLADEIYLSAGRPIPDYEAYEELPQLENGVGLIARLRHHLSDLLSRCQPPSNERSCP